MESLPTTTVSFRKATSCLLALVFSVSASKAGHTHDQSSLTSILRLDRIIYTKKVPRVTLSNNETGPAIIRKFTIKLNDEEIPRSDEKSAAAIAFEGFDFGAPYEVNAYRPHKRDAIAPGKAFKLMEIEDLPIDEAERKKPWEKLHDVKFEITYASVYGEEETLKV